MMVDNPRARKSPGAAATATRAKAALKLLSDRREDCTPPAPQQDDVEFDCNWQPLSQILKRLVRRYQMPTPTARMVLESAGFNVEAAE